MESKVIFSPPKNVSVSAEGVGDKGEVGGSVVGVGSGVEDGSVVKVVSGAEVQSPVSDTLVQTSLIVFLTASVKMGGGIGIEVGGIGIEEVMGEWK